MRATPDILVLANDLPEIRLIAEVKKRLDDTRAVVRQVALFMRSVHAPLGLIVSADRMIVLRDKYLSNCIDDVEILDDVALGAGAWDGLSIGEDEATFEGRVQTWLRDLADGVRPRGPQLDRPVMDDWIRPALQNASVQGSRPRWRRAG